MALDLLGIWDHLNIQNELTKGITSVTSRMRYYTLLAWYWKNLDGKPSPKDYEKIFILACLAHHDGNSGDPRLLHVFDKTKFKKDWAHKTSFDLSFEINGFGKTYYNTQLEIFGCAWIDEFGRKVLSPINDQLASCIDVNQDYFENSSFTRETLRQNLSRFCICNSETNQKEIEIMSKLFFGFFSQSKGEWNLDEKEFEEFIQNNHVDLEWRSASSPQLDLFNHSNNRRLQSLKRRNTLFLFLTIIKQNDPLESEIRRTIWDAIYFGERRKDKTDMNFGRLESIRSVWEFFQLNIYYVFAIESVLDVIQRIVRTNLEIATSEITPMLKEKLIRESLVSLIGKADVKTLGDITTSIEEATRRGTKTSLRSKVNEADTFDIIRKGTSNEERLAAILVMLVLLRQRFLIIKEAVPETSSNIDEHRLVPDSLRLTNVLSSIDEKRSVNILAYLKYLIEIVINRHLIESTSRLSWGTKNWIFSEEGGVLYPARRDIVEIRPRDNRWSSILNLLLDTKFVRKNNGQIDLTEKGELWLSKIE